MFFDNWLSLARVLVVGTSAYVALVVLLRISGKRTLAKLNAFDLVVTVALGSTLATVLLSSDIALAEGVLALALLLFLQWAATWTSVRSRRFRGVLRAEPSVLVRKGEFVRAALRRERVTEDEVYQVLRQQGVADLTGASLVLLESDGTFSVLKDEQGPPGEPSVPPGGRRGVEAASG